MARKHQRSLLPPQGISSSRRPQAAKVEGASAPLTGAWAADQGTRCSQQRAAKCAETGTPLSLSSSDDWRVSLACAH